MLRCFARLGDLETEESRKGKGKGEQDWREGRASAQAKVRQYETVPRSSTEASRHMAVKRVGRL